MASVRRRAPTRRTRARSLPGRPGTLLLVGLLVLACARIASEAPPPLHVRRTIAAYVRLPGSRPALAWPQEGQAAVGLQGISTATAASGATAPVPIASVAKVMTAYLTLLDHPLGTDRQGFTLRVTPADVAEEGRREALDQSILPVRAGERMSERQALQALLLPSANNIAWLLAAHEGGVKAFLARMNAAARHLGMSATTYTDPSGFEATTVSSAADQLKLARVAMGVPAFAALVDERSAVLPVAGRVANFNALVGHDGYVGVKTGSDAAAGGCLMFAKRIAVSGRPLTVLGVVLGQRSGPLVEAALASAQRLGDSAAAAVHLETVLAAGTPVLDASANDGQHTTARTAQPLRAVGWPGLAVHVTIAVTVPTSQVRSRQRLGTVAIDAVGRPSTTVVAAGAVASPSLGWRLRHIL